MFCVDVFYLFQVYFISRFFLLFFVLAILLLLLMLDAQFILPQFLLLFLRFCARLAPTGTWPSLHVR